MVEEILLSVGVLGIVTAAVAYGYHYVTGNEAGVDIDRDGEDDIEFEEGDPFEEPNFNEVYKVASETAQEIGGELAQVKGLGETKAEALIEMGFETAEDLYFADDEELLDVSGIGETTVERIREHIGGAE